PALPLEMAFIEALERPVVEAPAQPSPAAQSTPGPQPGRPAAPAAEPSSKSTAERPKAAQAREEAPRAPAEPAAQSAAPRETAQPASPQDQQATQTLSDSWQRILAAVRQQNPKAYGYLNSCKSRFMRGDMLVIYFASDLLKNSMEKPENLEAVQRVLFQVFQREITLCCFVDAARRDNMPPGVEDDGMIAAALRDLGGELADIQ
ncbi:MAG: hypothetical protein JXB15_05365, partial [Anaerolineales bacterium]|nr:hypothetical protein [Anaerolineales bacterium]